MTVAEFLKKLKHPRAEQLRRLDRIIRKVRPRWQAKLYGVNNDMVGFGEYDYVYDSGRSGTWFSVGYAARKNQITLYSMATRDGQYLTELYAEDLGPVKIGKSCVYIKDLDQIDAKALEKFLRDSFRTMEAYCREQGWKLRKS